MDVLSFSYKYSHTLHSISSSILLYQLFIVYLHLFISTFFHF